MLGWDNGPGKCVSDMEAAGRSLVVLGVVIVGIGLAVMFAGRVPFLGRLPGDIEVQGDGWTLYAPLATSIVLSIVLTAVLNLFGLFGSRR